MNVSPASDTLTMRHMKIDGKSNKIMKVERFMYWPNLVLYTSKVDNTRKIQDFYSLYPISLYIFSRLNPFSLSKNCLSAVKISSFNKVQPFELQTTPPHVGQNKALIAIFALEQKNCHNQKLFLAYPFVPFGTPTFHIFDIIARRIVREKSGYFNYQITR